MKTFEKTSLQEGVLPTEFFDKLENDLHRQIADKQTWIDTLTAERDLLAKITSDLADGDTALTYQVVLTDDDNYQTGSAYPEVKASSDNLETAMRAAVTQFRRNSSWTAAQVTEAAFSTRSDPWPRWQVYVFVDGRQVSVPAEAYRSVLKEISFD